jgi:uncharacterized protein YjbI with pentapeptide repeats
MNKTKKAHSFNRDTPDLPHEFDRTDPSAVLITSAESLTLTESHVADVDRSKLETDSLQIEGSQLERVQLKYGKFGAAVWKDVRFIGCDLSNVRANRFVLVRAEFIECRLTGLQTRALEWQHVLAHRCDLSYAQLQGGTFRHCEFDTCNLQDADFGEADLSGSVLRSCNLVSADFRSAVLKHTDLRQSQTDGIIIEPRDLDGAIVDPAQAMDFARLLGLQIMS